MKIAETNNFKLYPETRVTFIDQTKKYEWPAWKKWNECNEKELKEINLREIFPDEIVLDYENQDNFEMVKNRLQNDGYSFYMYHSGSRGFHVHLFFYNLGNYSLETRNNIRKKFITRYGSDLSKSSERTLVAMFNKPHFKTMSPKILVYDNVTKDSINLIRKDILTELREELDIYEKKKNLQKVTDDNFKEYHKHDLFFEYISNNVINDNMERNNIVFPNLAIALVKEGLSEKEIRELMEPIIKKNFPGKIYNEFYGWVKKALAKEIETYNEIQINKWMTNFAKRDEIYDIKGISTIDILLPQKQTERQIYTHAELMELQLPEIQWIVSDWLPAGDICFLAGKAASFKSTIVTHIGFAIAENRLVFNKYKVVPGKVLYLNEENTMNNMKNIIKRCAAGLDITMPSKNIFFSTFQNYKIDNPEDIKSLITFINKNSITLLIMDSLRRFFIGEENDATKMNELFNNFKLLRSQCPNLTIITLHHSKKDSINKGEMDMRDMLRGSSDIVNSADTVIGVKRKTGKNIFVMEHIKNRAGEELQGKVIQIDSGDKKDKAYFFETDLTTDKTQMKSEPELCAEAIVKILEDKKTKIFVRSDIDQYHEVQEYSRDTVTKALRILCREGTINSTGTGRYVKYLYNQDFQTQIHDEPDSNNI